LIRTVLPIALVGYFGWKYLHGLTLSTPTVLTAATGAAIGLAAGAVVLATITVERDHGTGRIYTRAGIAYFLVWFVVLAARVVFLLLAENSRSFQRNLGEFMLRNHLDSSAIAAFFILMALAMVLLRSAGVWLKIARLPKPAGTETITGARPPVAGQR
ncbi:MAG: hypothetical protein J2O49_10925, partial [Sciscionella sp.]|nr:hypothetical protein [Sciscionella sp.]